MSVSFYTAIKHILRALFLIPLSSRLGARKKWDSAGVLFCCPVVQTLFPLNQPDEQGKFFVKIRTIVSVPSIYLRKLSYSSGSVSISSQYKLNIKETIVAL